MLASAFRLHRKDRWLFTLGLAQAGEFGFVLISFSLQQEVMGDALAGRLLLMIALSMLITPLLFILYDVLTRRIKDGEDTPPDEVTAEGKVIIAGIGRFGQIVNRLVRSAGYDTVVVDNNLSTVQMMRKFGYRGFFGDPTRPDLLTAAGLEDAKVLVVAIDDKVNAVKLVRYARKARPDLHIIARARDRVHVHELYDAGADDIVRELFDSSLRAGRYVLENLGLSEFEAAEIQNAFYQHDRKALRELAELWQPGVSVSDLPDYVARARALNSSLEMELLARAQKAEADRQETEN